MCAASARGIIPANTGRIPASPASCWFQGDHPREYGENNVGQIWLTTDTGSSPRIRGESGHPRVAGHPRGIIPANTGRMVCHLCTQLWRGDHPREYGENRRGRSEQYDGLGSSPRIRGEFVFKGCETTRGRIIPANTGRMAPTLCLCCSTTDHPREYGENAGCIGIAKLLEGSSPRIRGECHVCSFLE